MNFQKWELVTGSPSTKVQNFEPYQRKAVLLAPKKIIPLGELLSKFHSKKLLISMF